MPLLRRLTPAQWARQGTHTESGAYGVEEWLEIYAEHLHQHERQILRNLEAWKKRRYLTGTLNGTGSGTTIEKCHHSWS